MTRGLSIVFAFATIELSVYVEYGVSSSVSAVSVDPCWLELVLFSAGGHNLGTCNQRSTNFLIKTAEKCDSI